MAHLTRTAADWGRDQQSQGAAVELSMPTAISSSRSPRPHSCAGRRRFLATGSGDRRRCAFHYAQFLERNLKFAGH